jgi:putative zinc finger/helix-turn-helix YgiT family protein
MNTSLLSPLKCRTCREKAVVPTRIDYEAEIEHDGRLYQVKVPQLDVLRCDRCRAVVLDDAANERVSEALRRAAGLLSPAEIRAGRKRLNLKQKEMASCLNVAESTLSRWETGGQIQQRAMDTLLRLFFDLPEVRAHLGCPGVEVAQPAANSIPVNSRVEIGGN